MSIETELIYLFVFFIVSYIIYSIYKDLNNKPEKKEETEIKSDITLNNNNINVHKFINDTLKTEYNNLYRYLGTPDFIEKNKNNLVTSVVYKNNLDGEIKLGDYNGLDYIKLDYFIKYNNHPEIMSNNLSIGKYLKIPESLFGPILYSSATFSIEQLNVGHKFNTEYKNTGKNKYVLLKCECNNINIGVISINFIMNMIKKYKNRENINMKLHILFRDEYDKIINNYLKNQNYKDNIEWYKSENLGE